MNIFSICSDLSCNLIHRPYTVAGALAGKHRVRMFGPLFDPEVWSPCAKPDFPLIVARSRELAELVDEAVAHLASEPCDLIYCCLPRTLSFGIALEIKRRLGIPVWLDCDDWALGRRMEVPGGRWSIMAKAFTEAVLPPRKRHRLKLCAIDLMMERRIRKADLVTVTNPSLREVYGGDILCHLRDENVFFYDESCREGIRTRLKIGSYPAVLFAGTPLRHKGVVELLQALLNAFDRPADQLRFLLMGSEAQREDVLGAVPEARDFVVSVGFMDFKDIPGLYSAADLVVIPQKNTSGAGRQLPSKLADSMMLDIPVIASRTPPIEWALAGAGRLVSPGDWAGISRAVRETLEEGLPHERGNGPLRRRGVELFRQSQAVEMIDRLAGKLDMMKGGRP
ncbi:MAG: glycosyltransferase [Verrucomicrobia bacterium]|nr:glycosyltransferase [Verrucomicrobiota bacterium]